ncbi:MAG: ABC exporter membrane fusion protein [Cyanobacteriota bacterium]
MLPESGVKKQPFLKPKGRWTITLAVAAALAATVAPLHNLLQSQLTGKNSLQTASLSTPAAVAVSALGRIEPQGEIIHLSAPTSAEGARVDRLYVKEGDRVRVGQLIADLDSQTRLQASLQEAKQQVKVAQARLAQVKAGAKVGEINAQKATIARSQAELRGEIEAQKATIARLESELSYAETEYQRYQKLYQAGAISASMFDSKLLEVAKVREQLNESKAIRKRTESTIQEQINEAKATLDQVAEVRPIDVEVAQAEVELVIAAVQRAEAELELAYVRSPIDGQVLKINTRLGEIVSPKGIVDLGQTAQMYVIAEVYETDVSLVRIGQQATITSEHGGFSGKLRGIVDQISLQINKKNIFDTDPSTNVDVRVVEVKIRLDLKDSQLVAGFTNLQVQVVIDI